MITTLPGVTNFIEIEMTIANQFFLKIFEHNSIFPDAVATNLRS